MTAVTLRELLVCLYRWLVICHRVELAQECRDSSEKMERSILFLVVCPQIKSRGEQKGQDRSVSNTRYRYTTDVRAPKSMKCWHKKRAQRKQRWHKCGNLKKIDIGYSEGHLTLV